MKFLVFAYLDWTKFDSVSETITRMIAVSRFSSGGQPSERSNFIFRSTQIKILVYFHNLSNRSSIRD